MTSTGPITGPLRLFDVRDTALSVDEVIGAVADPSAGGVAVFIGMVRNHTGDHGHGAEPGRFRAHPGEAPATTPGSASASTPSPCAPSPSASPISTSPTCVTGLEYIAHPSAVELLRETAAKVLVDHPVTALAAVHRTGSLAVGDLAVVCAAAAPHRAEAFAACRALIDTLKAQVPIWKREEFEDGSHIWVGC